MMMLSRLSALQSISPQLEVRTRDRVITCFFFVSSQLDSVTQPCASPVSTYVLAGCTAKGGREFIILALQAGPTRRPTPS
jgi:hypothetical protein